MSSEEGTSSEGRERLHKFLARAGVGSRRACEEYIRQGRVSVDRQVVRTMGFMVAPESEEVRFDDELVRAESHVYFLAYKPRGVVCTTSDQFARRSVVDLVRDRRQRRLFPVGRLEEDSEGLIIVTNDGTLAHTIADYRRPIRHTYFVKVRGTVSPESLETLRKGVWLSDGRTSPMHVKVQRPGKKVTTLLVTPAAYQHRQLRRVMAKAGLHVDRVVRVRIGPLTTHGLKKGEARRLSADEVRMLLHPREEDLVEATGARPQRRRPGDRERAAKRKVAPQRRRPRGGVQVRKRQQQQRRKKRDDEAPPGRRIVRP